MEEYNPLVEHDKEQWLALDDYERLDLVASYVENHEVDLEEQARQGHTTIHVIVENQIAENIEPTCETYSRLMRQGLDRHETLHAIGAVIIEDVADMLNDKTDKPFVRYKHRLRKLTAKRWRKGKW